MLKNYLLIFLISMVPIIELRGAIPIGLGMGLPVLPTYLLCVLGSGRKRRDRLYYGLFFHGRTP